VKLLMLAITFLAEQEAKISGKLVFCKPYILSLTSGARDYGQKNRTAKNRASNYHIGIWF
jgi:hypothetical protein